MLELKEVMVIANDRIISSSIAAMTPFHNGNMVKVTFQGGRSYDYATKNLNILKNPQYISPENIRLYIDGIAQHGISGIYKFSEGLLSSFYHIEYESGRMKDEFGKNVRIVHSALSDEKAKTIFDYLENLADLFGIDDENGNNILLSHYQKLDFLSEDTALALFLRPDKYEGPGKLDCTPIFPFGSNRSQMKAVSSALSDRVSIIEGPPGTGKTQTILNIIANLIVLGKTVQVVSNNNSATDNVFEKLEKYGLSFIAATLGRTDNKKDFICSQSGEYPTLTIKSCPDIDEIKETERKLKEVYTLKEKVSKLSRELEALKTEHIWYSSSFEKIQIDTRLPRMESSEILTIIDILKKHQEKKDTLPFLRIFYFIFIRHMADARLWQRDISSLIRFFEGLYYDEREREIEVEIENAKARLSGLDSKAMEDKLSSLSLSYLNAKLREKYGAKTERRKYALEDLWRDTRDFQDDYPVVLSTTYSASSSLSRDAHFDVLIMDESSQIDNATGALALSSAKSVVVVGDTKQLPNVMSDDDRRAAEDVFQASDIDPSYDAALHSFLDTVALLFPSCSRTLLSEHYRCHPKIIEFCNKKFYGGRLIAMTEDRGEKDVLSVIRTAKGNHARGHMNLREAECIEQEVLPKINGDLEDVGIIAPYNAQVRLIKEKAPCCDVSTVHKFQGREKDTIILSTTDNEVTEFSDDPNLINVAVSRAVKRFVLVTNGNDTDEESNIGSLEAYISYNSFTVTDSRLHSVFDCLYDAYGEERMKRLKGKKRISEYDSENLIYALIKDILSSSYECYDVIPHYPMQRLIKDTSILSDEEARYALHPHTHIDFLIFSRLSKKPMLAIEVDGFQYHKEGTVQSGRDRKKDHILSLYGLPLLRLNTTGSGEEAKIRDALESAKNHCKAASAK